MRGLNSGSVSSAESTRRPNWLLFSRRLIQVLLSTAILLLAVHQIASAQEIEDEDGEEDIVDAPADNPVDPLDPSDEEPEEVAPPPATNLTEQDCSQFKNIPDKLYICLAQNRALRFKEPEVCKREKPKDINSPCLSGIAVEAKKGKTAKRQRAWRGATTEEKKAGDKEHGKNVREAFMPCQDEHPSIVPGMSRHNLLYTLWPVQNKFKNHGGYCTSTTQSMMAPFIAPGSLPITAYGSIGVCIRGDFDCVCCSAFECHMCCRFRIAPLVEYYYPAYTVDVSEAMFQSLYVTQSDVHEALEGNKETDRRVGEQLEATFELVGRKIKASGAVLTKNRDMKYKDLDYSNKARDASDDAYKAVERLRKYHNTNDELDFLADGAALQYVAKDSARQYGRTITEPLNIVSLSKSFIPHVAQQFFFGTDFSAGYVLSKYMPLTAMIMNYQNPVRRLQPAFNAFLSDTGEFNCIRNNIATGKTQKTREELGYVGGPLRNLVGKGRRDEHDQCASDIGEAVPLTDARRLHISDASFVGANKTLAMFHGLMRGIKKHTYMHKIDKWHVIRPNALRNESPVCAPFEQMTKVNTKYNKANMKEIQTGGEASFSVYPVFKGCWGYKNKKKSWWSQGSCPGFVLQWGDSKLGQDFRLK